MHCYNRILQTGYFIGNRNLSPTVLEPGKSKIKGFDEGLVFASKMVPWMLHSLEKENTVSSHGRRQKDKNGQTLNPPMAEEGEPTSGSSFYSGINLFIRVEPS